MHIAYFITGHGFGHALRSTVIAGKFSPGTRITFISNLPESFFKRELSRPFTLLNLQLDCGCIQKDFVTVDIKRTLDRYTAIAGENTTTIKNLVQWCREEKVDGIVSDIVPAAFRVAERSDLPSIAVTNFTWFDIYSEYTDVYPVFEPELAAIKLDYMRASRLLAMNPALPMNYFRSSEQVPLIGRKGDNKKELIHHYYGTPAENKMALIYIGDFGLSGTEWELLRAFRSWEFFGLQILPGAPPNYHTIDATEVAYPDLIASADCVIGKLGYGLVAEAMVNGTPIIYLPRNDFAEYPVLEKAVTEWGGGICISREKFSSLDWDEAFSTLGKMKPPTAFTSEGATECAERIESLITG